MTADVKLSDDALSTVVSDVTKAALEMDRDTLRPPLGELRSLTGLGAALAEYLRGVEATRRVLADAARSAADDVEGLRAGAGEVDAGLLAVLGRPSAGPTDS